MTERENCLKIVDEIHELAHKGGFDNMDMGLVETASSILAAFLEVKVSLDQASRLTGLHKSAISNKISRKGDKNNKMGSYRLISWTKLKALLGK